MDLEVELLKLDWHCVEIMEYVSRLANKKFPECIEEYVDGSKPKLNFNNINMNLYSLGKQKLNKTNLNKLIEEMAIKHQLQLGEVCYLISGWYSIHYTEKSLPFSGGFYY